MLKKLKIFIKGRTKKVFYTEVLILLVLLSMPFWFIWARSLPLIEEFETVFFSIGSFGFNNIRDFAFFYFVKFSPMICLMIWYFTCQNWWRYSLLVPLIFAVIQFIHFMITDNFFDDSEFVIAILFSFPIIMVMIFISNKLRFYNSNTILATDIRNEIFELLNNMPAEDDVLDLANKLATLKKQRFSILEEKYLVELIRLRNETLKKLKI